MLNHWHLQMMGKWFINEPWQTACVSHYQRVWSWEIQFFSISKDPALPKHLLKMLLSANAWLLWQTHYLLGLISLLYKMYQRTESKLQSPLKLCDSTMRSRYKDRLRCSLYISTLDHPDTSFRDIQHVFSGKERDTSCCCGQM